MSRPAFERTRSSTDEQMPAADTEGADVRLTARTGTPFFHIPGLNP